MKMQFAGLSALRENFPVVEVGGDDGIFDLHNDAELRELAYDYAARTLRITWTLKQPAWTTPERPEPSQRPTVASATLLFTGVRSLRMAGELVTPADGEGGGLDFVEYKRLAPGLGEIRFVFGEDAQILLTAGRCELRTTRSVG